MPPEPVSPAAPVDVAPPPLPPWPVLVVLVASPAAPVVVEGFVVVLPVSPPPLVVEDVDPVIFGGAESSFEQLWPAAHRTGSAIAAVRSLRFMKSSGLSGEFP
jgi:hypothetical protein